MKDKEQKPPPPLKLKKESSFFWLSIYLIFCEAETPAANYQKKLAARKFAVNEGKRLVNFLDELNEYYDTTD